MAARGVTAACVIAALVAGCGGEDFPPAAEPAVAPPPDHRPTGRAIPVGKQPEGLVVDAASGIAAVVTRDPSALTRVDLDRRRVIGTTPLPATARHLSLAHPGGPVLVPVEQGDELVEARLQRGGSTTIPVGDHPHDAVAVGSRVFVGDELSNEITVLDRGEGPTHVAAAGGRAWVADTDGRAILTYAIGGRPRPLGGVPAGGSPYGIAVDPRRGRLWVTLTDQNEVAVFDIAGGRPREVRRYPTLRQPNSVAVDERDGTAVIAARASGRLELIPGPR